VVSEAYCMRFEAKPCAINDVPAGSPRRSVVILWFSKNTWLTALPTTATIIMARITQSFFLRLSTAA
jgi:hypothetical protein